MGIRNREEYFNLHNDSDDDDSDSDDDILKNIQFSQGVMLAEQEIMQLYKETFNIDPLDRSRKSFTPEQHIERCAQNIAFWQKLLFQYSDDIESMISNPRHYYIKMKEAEVRVNILRRFMNDKDVMNKISDRLLELMNGNT